MSRKPRRNHSPALKAEVALEWSGRRIEDLQFALAESLKRQVSAGLQLLKLSKLGSNSGRGLVRELCPRAAAPLIHLPLEPQRLIRQLGVGSSSWQNGEAAVHRRLTLERQMNSTLLPDCAINPPAARADNLPAATSRRKA